MNPGQVPGYVLPGLSRLLECVHARDVRSNRTFFQQSRDFAEHFRRWRKPHHLARHTALRGLFLRYRLVAATRWPPSFKTRNDRFCVSPPIKSKTTSTFSRRTFSNCAARQSITRLAPMELRYASSSPL